MQWTLIKPSNVIEFLLFNFTLYYLNFKYKFTKFHTLFKKKFQLIELSSNILYIHVTQNLLFFRKSYLIYRNN